MKLLVVLVSLVAIYIAHCRGFPDVPEGLDSTDEDQHVISERNMFSSESQILEKKSLPASGKQEEFDSLKEDKLKKKEKRENKNELRRSRCKARNACVVMAGFCVTNATLCSGRLVPEGCKGTNCQCCVPGTLELKINHLEMELQSMRNNITNDNSDIKMELRSMKSSFTNDKADIKRELHSMESNLTNVNQNIETELHSVKDNISAVISNQGCTNGMFMFSPSSQCFMMITDTRRTWSAANSKCQELGLLLAQPHEPISLRNYLVTRYGLTYFTWLGGRGDGSAMRWQHGSRQTISTSSPLWYSTSGGSSGSTSHCLGLETTVGMQNGGPDEPFYPYSCTSTLFTLCERVME